MKLEDYIDFEFSIGVGDGKKEKFKVMDTFDYAGRNLLVIAPSKQIEEDDETPEILFVEVEGESEDEENALRLISDESDYGNLFDIYGEICKASAEECDCDDCCDDDEEELITFKAKDEDGVERILSIWDTFFYEDHKFNLCIPADSESDKVSEVMIFEVMDYEADEDDPEFDKDWIPVDPDLAEELCEYLEGLYEEEEEDEDQEDE